MLKPDIIENIKHGEELNHLAGLLFNRAAREWQWGVGIQMVMGAMMVLLSEGHLNPSIKLGLVIFALSGFTLGYYLRFVSEDTFDMAETMRRQSVLSEGLGWDVNRRQFAIWKARAGTKVINEFKHSNRPVDYWDTKASPGPRRLLELTAESAFWAQRLYMKLRGLMWLGLVTIISAGIVVSVMSFIRHDEIEASAIVSLVFLLLPALLIFDFLDWIFKLNRVIDGIVEIESDMEMTLADRVVTRTQVLRLVAEFNATASGGFPIHPSLYRSWHNEIKTSWEKRKKRR
ncbi:MAG: hypothetical protein A2751_02185 [Candidatus Doudnabacteria bacterium RIFCSPHIGHO2_01_FULL_46_14]|uniref:Uncharacterized protein n=1 Tax=Candidatus Doudnabacteria bacterium RIFCSPHIGHO2_01_FULL_46_14 TaxID=1817824 RepID=A0A1F5NJW2_9BACT|nr:MAG: hypothetical protein A2751_02185 [Candidatus Doudnabacteria bacterium RIFCSPHIGHO2_01_FULL_46_14]